MYQLLIIKIIYYNTYYHLVRTYTTVKSCFCQNSIKKYLCFYWLVPKILPNKKFIKKFDCFRTNVDCFYLSLVCIWNRKLQHEKINRYMLWLQ